jgi:cobalt-zinc-cadmium efflux system outer membrane protein
MDRATSLCLPLLGLVVLSLGYPSAARCGTARVKSIGGRPADVLALDSTSTPDQPTLETPGESPLTLDEAIEEALTRSPDLYAAAETVAQADAELKTASLFPNPQLLAGTTLQALPGNRFTKDQPGGPPQYNFDLAQQVDTLLFGKRAAAIESARRGVDVAGADLADLKRQRTGDVAAAFFDVLEARARLELAHVDLDDLRRVEELTRRRVQIGGSTQVDLDRARLAVATTAQDLRTAETTRTAVLATLRSLLGRGTGEPGLEVTGSLEVPRPPEPPDLETALRDAEQARASLVSLRLQIARWEAETRSQKRQAFPTVTVQAGYIYQVQEPQGLKNFNEWEASTAVSLPLFDRNQGNIAKAGSQERQARHALEAARIALRAELAQALAALSAARAGVVADDPAQLEAARSVRDRMEAAYKLGGRTILEVLDAERAYRDAMRLHIGVESGYWHALYRFKTAAGAPIVE